MHDEVEFLIEQILAQKGEADAGEPVRDPSCPDVVLLMAVALEQAPEDRKREVEEHAARCEECRWRLEDYRKYFRDEDVPRPAVEGSLLAIAADRRPFVPKPQPGTASEPPSTGEPIETGPLGPGYTQMILRGDTGELVAELRPWVPFLLQHLGLAPGDVERLQEPLLSYIVAHAGEVTPRRRFRDLLPGWLTAFAAAQGLTMTLPPPTTQEWENLLRAAADQEAVTWVLSQAAPDEPENLRSFRHHLLALRPATPQFLREYRSEEEQGGDRAVARFRRQLAATCEQRQQQRYRKLELTAA